MARQADFVDADERLQALSAASNPLEGRGAVIDFELFLPDLDASRDRDDPSRGGPQPYDAALMFRILILQPLW